MIGLAERSDGYSRILKNNLVIGKSYSLQELSVFLNVDPVSMGRKGVVPRGDAQLLFLHLEKDQFSVPQYEDHLEGSVLFWSGQNRVKSVKKALLDGTRDTFVFIQPARKTPFKYYGRAYPLRMQIHWEYDVPSHIVFELFEFAAYQQKQERMMYDGSFSTDKAIEGDFGNIVSEKPIKTEKQVISKIRISQSSYRNKALSIWNNRCAVTSVDNPSWLIASHIKPWHESNDFEKIDPFNSLILSPNFDKLFDRGVISFSPKTGKIILPETQSKEMWNNLYRMHVDDSISLSQVPEQTAKYLEYHNNYVYSFEPRIDINNEEFVESLVAKAFV